MSEQRSTEQGGGGRPTHSVPAMFAAIGVLALIVMATGGLLSRCSFTPTGPTVDRGSAPRVDASRELRRMAREVDFPVRKPALPPGWHANSADDPTVPRAGGARAARVGWITPSGHYLRLSQSTAPEEALVGYESGKPPLARGVTDAGGTRWVVYSGQRSEQVWVAQAGETRLLITGSGDSPEFRALAQAVQSAPPLSG